MENLTTLFSSAGTQLTDSEATALVFGSFFGMFAGMFTAILVVGLIVAVLMIIAWWRIFTKAGEKGWKSIIPIYNLYIYCKIVGISFWKWIIAMFVLGFVGGLFTTSVPVLATIISIANAVVSLIFYILMARNTAKAFGKGTGFAVGLFFLPNIFQLILAFGSAEYKGVPSKE